ncbi:MFS transporter [Prolixibacteraceae bacterium JC049]|nr:MFS transporter [Prolixibacteraceae bacterium JC049]
MLRSYAHNIYALYIIKISKWFNLVMPIIVLFFQDNDLTMKDIFILKAIYSTGIVALEIPSGYFADVLGRRKTLLIGSVFGAAGFLGYSLSHSFWGFVAAELILGIGQSFISGADSALLYDSLKAQKRKSEYTKLEGRMASVGNYAEALAGILAGLLATISFRTPVYCQVFVSALAIPAAYLLIEPKREMLAHPTMGYILKVVKESMTDLNLRTAILFSSLIGTSTLTFAWLIQPYFQQIDLPVALFGTMWTALNLTVGTSSIFAYKIENRLKQRGIYLLILLGIPVIYILAGFTISTIGMALLFLFYFLRGIATPSLKNNINHYTTSNVRATVLSVRNFIIRILFIAIGPFAGWLIDNYSLSTAYWSLGIIILTLGIAILTPYFLKHKKLT